MFTETINPAEKVREVIGNHILADGFHINS